MWSGSYVDAEGRDPTDAAAAAADCGGGGEKMRGDWSLSLSVPPSGGKGKEQILAPSVATDRPTDDRPVRCPLSTSLSSVVVRTHLLDPPSPTSLSTYLVPNPFRSGRLAVRVEHKVNVGLLLSV